MNKKLLFLLGLLILGSGCARFRSTEKLDYRTVEDSSISDVGAARTKHERALELINVCCLADAEQCLHESLLADKSFGPAHNTLGKLYFDQKKFYLAAWEFEFAMKTMPNRPEPVNNLGLVYESVGQNDQAIVHYHQAVEMAPENAQYLGNLIRARIRRGDCSADLYLMLENLIFLDNRQPWVQWAKLQLGSGKFDGGISSVNSYDGSDLNSAEPIPAQPALETAEPRSTVEPSLEPSLEPSIEPSIDPATFGKGTVPDAEPGK